MAVKFVEYPVCNHCDSPVTDLTKALRLLGSILTGNAGGVAEEVHGTDEKIFHKDCLAKLLGMQLVNSTGIASLLSLTQPYQGHCSGCRCNIWGAGEVR